MAYTEILRVRRVLLIYSIIVVALTLLSIGGVLSSPEHGIVINDTPGRHHNHTELIPLSILLLIAGYVTAIIGSILGTSLSAERSYVSQAWTKPVSRERFALTYMGVDALGLLAAFAVMLVVGELLSLWAVGVGRFISVDAHLVDYLLLGLGVTFAYYGVVQALAVGIGRGGIVAGLSWPVGLVLVLLGSVQLPGVIHAAIVGLNFLNPIAYLTSVGSGRPDSALPIALPVRIVLVWVLAVVSCATAVVIWKRLED